MASLRKRGNTWQAIFNRRLGGKREQAICSLGTGDRREAMRILYELEDRYKAGEIDPFSDWTYLKEKKDERRPAQRSLTLAQAAELFIQSRAHVSERTRFDYRSKLNRLEAEWGAKTPVVQIGEADVRAFCYKSDYSRATQATYLRFCRTFCAWLAEEDYVPRDVAAGIRYPRKKEKISDKTITEEQLHEIFRAFKRMQRKKWTMGHKAGFHSWFKPLVAVFFYAGLRRGEVLKLTWDKIHFDGGFIEITDTKPGRERVVPIQQKLRPYIEAWHRLQGRPDSGRIFFRRNADGGKVRLTRDNVTKTFKKYVRAAGLPAGVNLHGLRHSCATELLRSGMDINQVSKILGHSSLEVTQIYEHLDASDLKRRMRELGL